ncbi:sensor histidine kinase [Pseudonocardia sp. GCM10023141]|uniref:sensor histidine kinase n=1 Tax=Pseudonocardia sp. GCM10023141 TaxID=3252653 RepID=UPI00360A904A
MRRPRSGAPVGSDAALVRRAVIRLGLQAAAGTAIVVAVLAGVIALVLVGMQNAADDTMLTVAVDRADDVDDPPANMWLAIRAGTTLRTTAAMPAGLPLVAVLDRVAGGAGPDVRAATVDGRDFVVRTALRTRPDGTTVVVQAALDRTSGRNQLAGLLCAVLIVGIVGLVLATVVGGWLARRAVAPLEAALALQRRFVADASHELRTPLTLLSTRAQMLRRRVLRSTAAPDVRTDVDGLVDDAGRLTAILDDLLLAADPREPAAAETVDVTRIAEDVAAAAMGSAAAAGVTLRTASDPGPAPVIGSPAALRRAVTALADNAVRHATSEVTITARVVHGRVVVDVTDDGPGIDPQVLPRLFERFASTGDGSGVGPRRYGLGLALVSDVATRHRGTVTAVAGPAAGGTTLRLELPWAPD